MSNIISCTAARTRKIEISILLGDEARFQTQTLCMETHSVQKV